MIRNNCNNFAQRPRRIVAKRPYCKQRRSEGCQSLHEDQKRQLNEPLKSFDNCKREIKQRKAAALKSMRNIRISFMTIIEGILKALFIVTGVVKDMHITINETSDGNKMPPRHWDISFYSKHVLWTDVNAMRASVIPWAIMFRHCTWISFHFNNAKHNFSSCLFLKLMQSQMFHYMQYTSAAVLAMILRMWFSWYPTIPEVPSASFSFHPRGGWSPRFHRPVRPIFFSPLSSSLHTQDLRSALNVFICNIPYTISQLYTDMSYRFEFCGTAQKRSTLDASFFCPCAPACWSSSTTRV